jgi:hypothetical protein
LIISKVFTNDELPKLRIVFVGKRYVTLAALDRPVCFGRLRAHTYFDDQGDAAPPYSYWMSADRRLFL